MKAIILAAGRGSRMNSMTEARPKCLVEFMGKPLLDWQLDAIRKAGISDIGIVSGYLRNMLSDYDLVEFHNSRWAETNMVSSLECAAEWLQTDSCIVSYSDIFYEFTAVQSLITSKAPLAVTYDPNWLELWQRRFENPLIDAETFRLNTDGTLVEIGNKPGSVEEVQGQYMGLLKFTPKGWEEVARIRSLLPATEQDSMHMTGTLQRIIQEGRIPVTAIPYNGKWGEVDSIEDLKSYQDDNSQDITSISA